MALVCSLPANKCRVQHSKEPTSLLCPTGMSIDPQLTAHRENVKKVHEWAAADGLVLWTLANYGWREFAFNWIASVRRAKIQAFFVAALDDE